MNHYADQFVATVPSFYNRYAKCSHSDRCFRRIHLTVYQDDAMGWETPVLAFCKKHGAEFMGVKEENVPTELLPFERLNEQMVIEAMTALATTTESYGLDDVLKKLCELGYNRQVDWCEHEDVSWIMSGVLAAGAIRAHYLNR